MSFQGSIRGSRVGRGVETLTYVGKDRTPGEHEFLKPWKFLLLMHGLHPRQILPSSQLRGQGYLLENMSRADENEVG